MKIRKDVLPVLKPAGGDEEIQAVADVINSGWWGKGPKVEEFEKDGEMIRYAGIHVNNPRLTLLEDAPSPSPALEDMPF